MEDKTELLIVEAITTNFEEMRMKNKMKRLTTTSKLESETLLYMSETAIHPQT